ncbi:MAG: glycerol-3-phosphate 1-O-acyltransferase PlsY [Phycisphaerales bacterium]|nr:glycerol-3-phosphate 1-O-acyltransferase PlsY [Phycisphaerales bacterium]
MIGFARGVDIRQHGSGNIGATNVGRVLGRRVAALCFMLDVMKGMLPALAIGWWSGLINSRGEGGWDELLFWQAGAVSAVLGHVFPVWLGFKGGKGVATGLGAMLGVFPVLTVIAAGALVVWLVMILATRYVSASSCAAGVSLPVWALITTRVMEVAGLVKPENQTRWWWGPGWGWPYVAVTALLGVLVLWTHRANIVRLRTRTEPKIGRKYPAAAADLSAALPVSAAAPPPPPQGAP